MFRTRVLTVLCAAFVLAVNSSGNPNPPAGSKQSQYPASKPEAQADVSGTWQGRVEALIVDNIPAGTSRTRLFLHTSHGTLELDGAGEAGLRAGQTVEITGRASGKRLVVSHVAAPRDEPAAGACSATGEQKALVILASFPSAPLLSSVTPTLMRNSFFGTGMTLDNFLRESSFGQTWATGDVLGPFVLDADYFDEPLAARDAALRAAAQSADLTQYSRIFVVAPQGEMGMDSGGMALLGCGQISSPQGVLYASSMWLGAESMVTQAEVVATAAHELGHGFGLEHARFADYGSDPLGPAGETAAPWDQIHEYGDSFSSMGRNSGQWAAPQKALLGWLETGANIQTVTANGTFNLSPYEQAGSAQVLRVSRDPSGNDWLWLEYRQAQGTFDATLPAAAFAGALAHYQDPALTATLSGVDPSTYTNLVNFHPAVAFADDPALHAGETWTDPYGSLSLTVNSATEAGLNVSVSYAAAPVCASSAGGAQSFDAAGGAGAIPVTASGACSWSAAASVPWITLGSATSGTGSGSLSFTVAANANVSPRWGEITVGDAFVVVTQAGGSGWMTISPQSASIPAAGGTGEISVATSAPDLAWTYLSNVPWITDVECSCYLSKGPATLRYIVAVNTGQQRSGTITVGSQVFAVTQDGGGTDPDGLTWNLLAPQNAPTARLNLAIAPFGHSGQAILYGGNWNTTRFNDTWLWNGSAWTLLQPANNPGILAGHAMAYDEARGQIVLFGGMAGATAAYSNQTWVWDGTNWRQMQPVVSPPARYGHAMAYDAVSQKVVLFGGYGDFAETNDTWTWDGSNWTQVASKVSPPARMGHGMAFDAMRGVTVLFGGFQSQGLTWFSDTWTFDGSAWQQMLSATPPAARAGHVLAYHKALQAVVMIGGAGGKDVTDTSWNYDFRRETWLWDGQEWVQQFPAIQPGPAYTMGAAYDDINQGLTVQVGDDLTCLSRGPKTFLLTGTADGAPVPSFTLTPGAASATVAPGASTPMVVSTTALNGFQSPVALSVSGMPAGVTASFAPTSIAAPGHGSSTLTLAAASGTATGSFNLTVTAIGGGVRVAQPVSVTVAIPPSFTLAPSATSATVTAGASTAISLSAAALNGFQSAVALSVSGLPAGVTASFAPTSVAAPGNGSSTLTLTAASGTAAGSFSLTVTASGGGLTVVLPVGLTVVMPPGLTLTPSITSATVVAGASTAIKLSTAALNGFQSAVALSVSGLRKGVTASFAPNSITSPGNGSSTLTLTAASGTAAGSFNLTVTASGGGLTVAQPVSLAVVMPPSLTLTPSITSATVVSGASTTIKLSTAALNGFQSAVALSVSGLPTGVTGSFAPAIIAAPGSGSSTLTLTAASGTAAGAFKLTVTASGGGVTVTQPVTLAVAMPPGLTLTLGAASATVTAGSSTPIKLSTAALNGFQSQVGLSVSGLPTGVTASFAPASIAAPGSGSSTFTLAAASATAAGSFKLMVTASGGGVTITQPLTLAVVMPPSFTLTPSATNATVVAGAATSIKLSTAALNGFQSAVALSLSGLPKGVTATFAPASIAAPGNGSSTLTLAAASGTAAGSFTLTMTASGGGVTKAQPVTLTVLLPPSFTLTASVTRQSVVPGASTAIKLSTAALNGFQWAVALSISGLPKGVTATFAPTGIAAPGNGNSTLTLAAASGTAAGSFTLMVTASGGGVTKTQPLTLTVKIPPSFALTASLTSAAVAPGASMAIRLSTAALNGFQSAVTLSVSGLPKGVTANLASSSIAAPGNGNSTLTLAAASGTAAASFTVTVTATGGGVTKTQPLTLRVL